MSNSPSKVYRVGEDLEESNCAVVHGGVKAVSPVKTSKGGEPYYQLLIGKRSSRVLGTKIVSCQEELSKMKRKAVGLVNCTIKRCLIVMKEGLVFRNRQGWSFQMWK